MESTIVQYSEKNLHLLVLRFFANQEDFNQTTHWFFEHASQSYFQERNCVVGLAPSPIIVHYCQTLFTGLNVSGLVVIVAWEHHQCI